MVFYFIFLFVILTLTTIGYVEASLKKNIYFVITFILLFISVFRYKVGFDYVNYLSSLNLIIKSGVKSNYLFYNQVEPAYKFIIIIAFYFKSSYLIFFISSLITILLVSISIYKLSQDYLLSIFIFFSFPFFYLDSFSIIRQWVAISIIFFGYSNLISNKKVLKFIFCILIASLFHSTAFLGILILPFIFYKINKRFYFIIILFCFILKIYFINLLFYFNSPFLFKINRISITQGGDKLQYFIYFISLIFFIYKNKLDSFSRELSIHINLFLFATPFIFIFSDLGQLAQRTSIYFYFTIIFIIPILIDFIKFKYKFNSRFIFYLMFIFIFIFSLYISFSRNNFSPIIPYKFIFNA
jgi:hypothetical protein